MDILDEFEAFKKEKTPKTTQNAKKVIAILTLLSFMMFIKFAPYGEQHQHVESTSHMIFTLYFFIISQTLGIVHEGGHGICYILGLPQFFTALNGTLFQLAFPLGIGYYYKRLGQVFPYLIGLFIFGISLHYTAWYISTAHQGLYLPASKSFLGVDGLHDFNYILSQMNLLSYNSFISGFIRFIAYLVMFYAVGKMLLLAFLPSSKKKRARQRRSKRL